MIWIRSIQFGSVQFKFRDVSGGEDSSNFTGPGWQWRSHGKRTDNVQTCAWSWCAPNFHRLSRTNTHQLWASGRRNGCGSLKTYSSVWENLTQSSNVTLFTSATNDIFWCPAWHTYKCESTIASLNQYFDPIRNKDMVIFEFRETQQESNESLRKEFYRRIKMKVADWARLS